jgi:hypothetical protein
VQSGNADGAVNVAVLIADPNAHAFVPDFRPGRLLQFQSGQQKYIEWRSPFTFDPYRFHRCLSIALTDALAFDFLFLRSLWRAR